MICPQPYRVTSETRQFSDERYGFTAMKPYLSEQFGNPETTNHSENARTRRYWWFSWPPTTELCASEAQLLR
jgi:hypothetical protein